MKIIRKLYLIITPFLFVSLLFLFFILAASEGGKGIKAGENALEILIFFFIVWTILMGYIYGKVRHTKWNIPILAFSFILLGLIVSALKFDIFFPHEKWIFLTIAAGVNLFYILHFYEKKKKQASDYFKLVFVQFWLLGILSLIFDMAIQNTIGILILIMSIAMYVVILNQVLGSRKKPAFEISEEENKIFEYNTERDENV